MLYSNAFREVDICKGVNIRGMDISNIKYADESVLQAEHQEYRQTLEGTFNVIGLTYNMNMNIKKTITLLTSGNTI